MREITNERRAVAHDKGRRGRPVPPKPRSRRNTAGSGSEREYRRLEKKVLSFESVSEGHPDKLCDQISDAILDEYLREDPDSRVAVECMAAKDNIIVSGEVSSSAFPDIENIVRNVILDVGYDSWELGLDGRTCDVQFFINRQSPQISACFEDSKTRAGDQVIVYGYATQETNSYIPLGLLMARNLSKLLAKVRRDGTIPHLGPDGKSMVSILYEKGRPVELKSVVISQQHTGDISLEDLRENIIDHVIKPALGEYITRHTKIRINSAGEFTLGGPAVDTGLTGRKIIVDTYGGIGRHGGGAFSGKDPTKLDRTAAYMARYIAKNIVSNEFAYECEVQLAYTIGRERPVSYSIDTFGTAFCDEEYILKYILENFDLTPDGMIRTLDLKRPIYRDSAVFGHFGDLYFPWEHLLARDGRPSRAKYIEKYEPDRYFGFLSMVRIFGTKIHRKCKNA